MIVISNEHFEGNVHYESKESCFASCHKNKICIIRTTAGLCATVLIVAGAILAYNCLGEAINYNPSHKFSPAPYIGLFVGCIMLTGGCFTCFLPYISCTRDSDTWLLVKV